LEYLASFQHAYAIIVDISYPVLDFLRAIFYQIDHHKNHEDFLKWWKEQSDALFVAYHRKARTDESQSWLLNETSYQAIRQLVSSGNIHLIRGDIADTGTQDLISETAAKYYTPITTIYLSNVLSPYGRMIGYNLDYSKFKRLFELDCFDNNSRCLLTQEFIPEDYRIGFYHYSICSFENLCKIVDHNNSVDEFLAYYVGLIMAKGCKGTSQFTNPIDTVDPGQIPFQADQVDQLIESSSDWLIWQNFKQNFLSRKSNRC
jgi:hypothetical protein